MESAAGGARRGRRYPGRCQSSRGASIWSSICSSSRSLTGSSTAPPTTMVPPPMELGTASVAQTPAVVTPSLFFLQQEAAQLHPQQWCRTPWSSELPPSHGRQRLRLSVWATQPWLLPVDYACLIRSSLRSPFPLAGLIPSFCSPRKLLDF